MKLKSLLTIIAFALGFSAVSAKADVLIDTSSCSWTLVYSQSGVVAVYNSVCSGTIPTVSKVVTNNGTSCSYTVNNSSYYVQGTCSGYSLYKKTATTSSPSSTPTSLSACKASGKAGRFVTSGSSSGVPGAAQTAGIYCAPQCGTYSTTLDNYTYNFYCSRN